MKLQFQRWPRTVQTAFMHMVLLLGVYLGAAMGMLAFWLLFATVAAIWTLWAINRRNHK